MRLVTAIQLIVAVLSVNFQESFAEAVLRADDYLAQGDQALAQGSYSDALANYEEGVKLVSDDDSLETELSLYTNMGTALSSVGRDEEASRVYEKAVTVYREKIDDIVEASHQADCKAIVAQAAFFLGMVYQDLDQPRDAADAYTFAGSLDPLHWASFANLGSVLHDSLARHRQAVEAYNKAYTILTEQYNECTDPPQEPRYILGQLQYRIGLCISHDPTQRCAVVDNPDQEISCSELAANAFSMALEFDETNESARHMLASVTADATMKRASNEYVKGTLKYCVAPCLLQCEDNHLILKQKHVQHSLTNTLVILSIHLLKNWDTLDLSAFVEALTGPLTGILHPLAKL